MPNSMESSSPASQVDIISRPLNQLHDLPVRFRWEASRRHPYYLVFWSDAQRYRRSGLGTEPAQTLLRQAAMLMLGAIGVTGEPVAPATSFEELDEGDLDPAFLSGALQPMTLRSVAQMLINALPRAERAVLGSVLRVSCDDEYAVDGDDANGSFQKKRASLHLAQFASPSLDSYPDAPLFYIHLGASQRTIVQDVKEQVRRWKGRRGIEERRVHTAKLQSYLDIWDQREGWTGSGYRRSEEHSFPQIVKRSKEKLGTVSNRYRAAFQVITGHEFSPFLWWRLFGPIKFNRLLIDPRDYLSRPIRRFLRPPVPRSVPESVVAPTSREERAIGLIEGTTAVEHDFDQTDLLIDLEDFINRGLPDDEIVRRLGEEYPEEEIAYARERLAELRKIQRPAKNRGPEPRR